LSDDKQRKPRIPAVRVDFGKEQTLSGMHVSDNGKLTFFDETGQPVSPAFVEVDSTYERKKGPKTLNRVVADPAGILLDQNSSLRRYRHVFAVDTNTAEIKSARTSITVSTYVTNIDFRQPRWSATLVMQDAFEFQDAVESPERIGWSQTAALIAKSNLEGPIAIIVDAHLGDLRAINDRSNLSELLPAACDGIDLFVGGWRRGRIRSECGARSLRQDRNVVAWPFATDTIAAFSADASRPAFWSVSYLGRSYGRCGRELDREVWLKWTTRLFMVKGGRPMLSAGAGDRTEHLRFAGERLGKCGDYELGASAKDVAGIRGCRAQHALVRLSPRRQSWR
jgi:hypothetical protein